MRVEGSWRFFDDGVVRPVIDAAVATPAGDWQRVMFLLDAGADRTVFDARFLLKFVVLLNLHQLAEFQFRAGFAVENASHRYVLPTFDL